MFQTTAQQFQAAVVARCFIVGFRYFRQTAANKARLAYTMANAVQLEAFGNVLPLEDLPVNNLFKLFTAIGEAQAVDNPEGWAAHVLLLSSTLFMQSAAVCIAAVVEVSEDTKENILVEFEKHIEVGNADAYKMYLAVSGHTRLSTKLSSVVPENYITVFDEDAYPAAAYEIPVLPESMSNWQTALTDRRLGQLAALSAYNAAQAAEAEAMDISDAMAEALGAAPEYDETLNREDIEAGYSSASEDEDLDR